MPSYLIPGTGYVNASGLRQAQIPGGGYFIDTLVLVAYYYPSADISAGNWTPSVGATLYGTLNETPASDANYDQSSVNPVADTMKVKVVALPPVATSNHVISYRIMSISCDMTVYLYSGATLIKSWTHPAATITTWTQFDQALNASTEVPNIGDYSNLQLWASATAV